MQDRRDPKFAARWPTRQASTVATLHPNTQRVIDAAAEHGLSIEVVEYPAGTRTAADAAQAIGCSVGQIVKSLVFEVVRSSEPGELVMAFVSGENQLDERKLAAAAGLGKARRADADAVRDATGFPIGGVPPFGHSKTLRGFLDPDLLTYEHVWAAAGTPNTVFRIEPQQLAEAVAAVVVDLRKG